MKKTTQLLIFSTAALALGATEPALEIVATSTNLVVTEQVQVSLVLRLPPVPGAYADAQAPFINKRPPHVTCPFLEGEWKDDSIDRGDPRAPLAPEQMPRRGRQGPAFTLNNYVTDSIFSAMDDPFDMDPFSHFGPKRQLFPFTVAREADKGWRLTAAVAPWRAVAPGKVRLPPVTVEVPLITGVKRGRDQFNRAVDVPVFSNVVLRTTPFTLTVAEPPAEGRPASWCGAIASNLTVKASLDARVCTAGDPLTLTLEVAGAANPSLVHPPDFSNALTGSVFRIDASSLKTETLSGARRFSWRVRPVKAGTVEFPSLPVSYYDLDRRAYITRTTDTIPIQVKAGLQVVLTDESSGEEFPMPDGIDLDPRGAECRPFLPHLTIAVLLFLVPPVLFICIRLAPPVRRRIAASNAAYRKARAFGVCRRALKSRNAERRAAAIRTFFTVRYGVNGAAVTAADAQRLMASDYAEEDIALIVTNLRTHDAQTYSAKPGAGAIAILLAVGLGLGGTALAEADAARAAFSYQRASALAVQATDEAGFRVAADAYRACLDAGADNACIYQNLGACLLLAGDTRGAVAAFGCAERRGGETPSTARGLKAARAKQTNNPRAELSPARIFLKPHVSWSVDMRLLCAAGLWAFMWLVALLPVGAVRRFLLTACLVAFCAAAISVGVSLVEEHHVTEVLHVQE